MMKTTDTRPRDDLPFAGAAHSLFRSLLLKPAVSAILMIVRDVGREQSLQMLLIYGDHVIQQFAAAAADPALGDTVLPRTSNCRSYSPNAHRANRGGNFAAVLGIVIQDKKLDWRLVRKGAAQLLRDPGAGGMACNVVHGKYVGHILLRRGPD